MNSLAQAHLNPVASAVATTLPTPPTDERRPSPTSGSYRSMSTTALVDQPRRQQTDSLPPFSLPQVTRPYSPSGSNLGGSLPTPPPGENYPPLSGSNGYQYPSYNSQPNWPTSAPQHSQHSQHYSLSMSDPNPNSNSPSGSYRAMSPSSNAYPIQPVSSAYNTYGGSPHSPPSRDSRNNSPYQGEYLPAPQGAAGLYGQPGQHQGSEQGHYQSYPPTNLPPLQHNPMMSQHNPSYQASNSSNGGSYNNYFQYSSSAAGSMPENSSTLPPPLNRPPLPAHMSHQYQPYQQPPPSSYPSSQPYAGGPPSSSWRFTSPPMHSSTDPALRNSPYARPPGMMRPGGGSMTVNNQDRPFKCDQCPQSFNRNHDLKRHKRIHLAVKPFPCPSCDKSFSRKDALKVFIPCSIILILQRHILVKGCGNRANEPSQPIDNANIQE